MESGSGSFPSYSVNSSTRIFFPSETVEFVIALKVVVATTNALSIIGAGMIILTYLAFPDIRTRARQLLVNLSIADLIAALATFLGATIYYDKLVETGHESKKDLNSEPTHDWCVVQAAFTVYGTESSILWTIAVALYMYVIIVLRRPKLGTKVLIGSYILCYGIPLILTLSLALTGYLGYEVGATPGFCAIKGSVGHNPNSTDTQVWPIIIGYEIWLYIAFIVLPVLYIAIKCHVKIKASKQNSGWISLSLQSVARTADRKLIFIPLIFMCLRIWSIVVDVSVYYLPSDDSVTYRRSYASAVLGILEGIGDSGQGFANGILFCVFTKIVRHKLIKTAKCEYCREYSRGQRSYVPQHDESPEPLTDSIVTESSREEAMDRSFTESSSYSRPLINLSNERTDYSAVDKVV